MTDNIEREEFIKWHVDAHPGATKRQAIKAWERPRSRFRSGWLARAALSQPAAGDEMLDEIADLKRQLAERDAEIERLRK